MSVTDCAFVTINYSVPMYGFKRTTATTTTTLYFVLFIYSIYTCLFFMFYTSILLLVCITRGNCSWFRLRKLIVLEFLILMTEVVPILCLLAQVCKLEEPASFVDVCEGILKNIDRLKSH